MIGSRQWAQKWSWLLLGGLWVSVTASDVLWLSLDQGVPAWDQSKFLANALYYFQHFQRFSNSPDWWASVWQIDAKYPPLLYILTVPCLHFLGSGVDQATLINGLFTAILLVSVYGLGQLLFSRWVGLLAATFCLLMPGLSSIRLEYMLDYPLVAMVTLSFACLTQWWSLHHSEPFYGQLASQLKPRQLPWFQWLWAVTFGLALGLASLTKQTAIIFLVIPLGWLVVQAGIGLIKHRRWQPLVQLVVAIGLAILVITPWVQNNWLFILTSIPSATVIPSAAENDPPVLSLQAWTYYLQLLPRLVSWLVLLIPSAGFVFYWRHTVVGRQWANTLEDAAVVTRAEKLAAFAASQRLLLWLVIFLAGAYFLNSLNPNKDTRYFSPALPALAVFLAYGLALIPRRWQTVSWSTLGITVLLTLFNLFPILPKAVVIPPFQTVQSLRHPHLNTDFPHAQVIAAITRSEPNLRSVVGVMTSTAQVNQHNVNLYGLLKDFQVRARQIASRQKQVDPEVRSLSWFLLELDQKNQPKELPFGGYGSTRQMLQLLENPNNFQLHSTWKLPGGSSLKLFHRQLPIFEVQPLWQPQPAKIPAKQLPVELTQVLLPEQAPPGKPLPITYRWTGSWRALQDGLMLLTWKLETPAQPADPANPENRQELPIVIQPATLPAKPLGQPAIAKEWLHDHAIALGRLYANPADKQAPRYDVTERLVTLPPPNLAPGTYALEVRYLNRVTGEVKVLPTPPVRLTLDAKAKPATVTTLPDALTQFRQQAVNLRQGIRAYNSFSNLVDLLNRAEPGRDYQKQVRESIEYRLKQQPNNRDYAYALAFTHVLSRKVEPAIAALQRVVKLDPKNPNAYGYLAFTYLYAFRPDQAQPAIYKALQLNPNQPELYLLKGVANLMRVNLVQVWQDVQTYQQKVKQAKQKIKTANTGEPAS